MIELPEAMCLAQQLADAVCGKQIKCTIAGRSPHKFAWFHGDPQGYHHMLGGKTIEQTAGVGGMVEMKAGDAALLFYDGVRLRYHGANEPRPRKHQLLIEFDDDTALSASVQMYGGLLCFYEGALDNPYYQVAQERPSPLTGQFDRGYFQSLLSGNGVDKLSAKAFLATGQRIPGLGNGVLQDILYLAGVHPKQKIGNLSAAELERLFVSVKDTLAEMTARGGRDTETDLYGRKGGYVTRMSKNSVGSTCPACGNTIEKAAYMGGSIYFCAGCQPL